MSEEEDLPLRRRVPGAARAAPAQAAPPVLPDAVLRRMQAAVDAARHDADEADAGPITEPIPNLTAQPPPAKTREAAGSPSAPRGRVVEFRRPAKRHRDESADKAKRADQSKRKHGGADSATSAPQARVKEQAPAAPQTRDAQQTTSAPAKPETTTRSAQPSGGAPPAGSAPSPLPKRRPTESPAAALRSDRDAAAAVPPASSQDAPPSVVESPARPSAAGTVPPALPEDVLAAAAAPPMRTVPTPAADRAALTRAPSRIPPDLREPHRTGTRPRSGRSRRPIGIAAALVILLAAGGVAIALAMRPSAPNAGSHKPSRLQRQELANTATAVAWIGQQVSPGSVIACDPATCADLKSHGYPAGKLQVLKPATPNPRTATLVVETDTVRGIYGTNLRSYWAPEVVAAFGTGAAGIDIRVVAPDGPSAYQQKLAADLANRKRVGRGLLDGSQIVASATARAQMEAGAVDVRLLVAITQIADQHPIHIIDFGNEATGSSLGMPLRYGDLSVPAARSAVPAYVAAVDSALNGPPLPGGRPLRPHIVKLPSGLLALRIEFPAPSPLGLFGG